MIRVTVMEKDEWKAKSLFSYLTHRGVLCVQFDFKDYYSFDFGVQSKNFKGLAELLDFHNYNYIPFDETEEPKKSEHKDMKEIYDSLTNEQKDLVTFLINEALKDSKNNKDNA